jgi:diguanylate cyclase (GGDEF)-like protein
MQVCERFMPRSDEVAKRVLFVLTVVAAGVTVLFTFVFPSKQTQIQAGVTGMGCLVLIAVATALAAMTHPPAWLWAFYPFQAVALLTVIDVCSHDASVTAQIFFFFPVLYAGAQLSRFAVIAICAAVVVGEAIVAFTVSGGSAAVADLGFVAAALATTATLLLNAGERNDRLIAQLERQAAVDPLTGLHTRRVLDTAVTSALGGAGDTAGTALLLMDVDGFKGINDRHGHPAGDAVLQQLARILLSLSREGDLVSRLGGDEIAVLLAGCPTDVAKRRAEEIWQTVRSFPFDVSGISMAAHHEGETPLSVTLSIGVAHLPTQARDLRALYAAADAALYEAKRNGRDQVSAPEPLPPLAVSA